MKKSESFIIATLTGATITYLLISYFIKEKELSKDPLNEAERLLGICKRKVEEIEQQLNKIK